MTPYEKIIKRMRKEGSHNDGTGLVYGYAISEEEIEIGDLKLDSDFFLKCEHVGKLKSGDTLICSRLDEDTYIILGKVG